jgi:Stress responsive A/B Barrel Domain
MLAHNVYFTLIDDSAMARQALVAACKKYLARHPGVVFFAAGTLQPELTRPVNDLGFDVALHVVFDSLASHDAYQQAPDHLRFIEENKPNWKQVRVFDSEVAGV